MGPIDNKIIGQYTMSSSNGSLAIFEGMFGIPLIIFIFVFITKPASNAYQALIILVFIEILIFIIFKGFLVRFDRQKIYYRYLFIFHRIMDISAIEHIEVAGLYSINIYTREAGTLKKTTIPLKFFKLDGIKKFLEVLPEARIIDY